MSERANWTRWAVSLLVTLAISGGVASCGFRDQVIALKARQDLLEATTDLQLKNIAASVSRIESYTMPRAQQQIPVPSRP